LIKIIYDHRTLDGSEVARRLKNIEDILQTTIREELILLASAQLAQKSVNGFDGKSGVIRQDPSQEPLDPNLEFDTFTAQRITSNQASQAD
jgi:hypothetical protein